MQTKIVDLLHRSIIIKYQSFNIYILSSNKSSSNSSNGPILFILYTKDLKRIAHAFGLTIQLYADDGQLYILFNVLDAADKSEKLGLIEACLKEIKQWMIYHFMKLNEDKTEFILFGKNRYLTECGDITLNFNDVDILQTEFRQ